MKQPSFFSGTYGGDNQKIRRTDRLECKICWTMYDPAVGDPVWQIPAGTPFAELPDHWSCPTCDGAKADFMVIQDTSS
jgi:rubredoxin